MGLISHIWMLILLLDITIILHLYWPSMCSDLLCLFTGTHWNDSRTIAINHIMRVYNNVLVIKICIRFVSGATASAYGNTSF